VEGGTLAIQNFPFGDSSISSASRQKLFLFQGQYFLLATKHIWVLTSKRVMALSPDYDVIQKRIPIVYAALTSLQVIARSS
jgi:hypothetical protein